MSCSPSTMESIGASSSAGSMSASSSFEKLDILDQNALNDSMTTFCEHQRWQSRLAKDSDEPQETFKFFFILEVLLGLIKEMKKTKLENSVISKSGAFAIVESLNDDGLKEWKDKVQNCVEKNDWTALIMHPKLRIPKVPNVALGVPIKYKDAVISAWKLEYRGLAHKVLLETIDDLQIMDRHRIYAKNVPIAQSSGMGKSKTVDKVATERILFPMCLREDIGKNYFAYPPADKVVRNYFDIAPGTTDEEECKQHIRLFLSSLFILALDQVKKLLPPGKKVPYSYMAKVFYDFFANPPQRDEFYENVVENARKRSYINVWESFENLVENLKHLCSEWLPSKHCPILISIDEVHFLYTHRRVDDGSEYTLYSRLKSVLNEGVEYPFAIISLSTASHVSSLAPSKEIAPSMRERSDELSLLAPFTELPFDVYIADDPLVSDQATLTSVGSLEFTAKFGRPLFYASYLSRIGQTNIVDGIMRNVLEKLSGRPWPPTAPADFDVSSIAILSARLLLDLSPATADAKRYEEELVRNHLRLLYSVHNERRTIVTGSSPEPLIAEASAEIMHYSIQVLNQPTQPYIDYWGLLSKFVDHGLAAQGAIGELIGRALSISAMDLAINKLELVNLCQLKYQTPVTVADYYKALLTNDAWETLRQSTPSNRARLSMDSATKKFEDAFKDAYFHFSHYAKANDSSPMCDKYAWGLWLRGTAVACQFNQELTDRMTPIYFSGLGNVSPKTISVNLDQDKTGRKANPINVSIQSAESLSIFSNGNRLPYIAAVHCYALTDQGFGVGMPSSYHLRNPKDDEEAPRYQIDFRGLSAYGNITDSVKSKIRTMINHSEDAVFINHSREYGVPFLRRMLPVLTKDPESTEWFIIDQVGAGARAGGRKRTVDEDDGDNAEATKNGGKKRKVDLN